MEQRRLDQFICFLQEELALPKAEVRLALRRSDQSMSTLPMVLWQYGMVTITQLDQIFDWLEQMVPDV
jgi:hypothetical protein